MPSFVLSASHQIATPQSSQLAHKAREYPSVKFAIPHLLALGLGFALLDASFVAAQVLSQPSPKATKTVLQGDTTEKNQGLPRTVSTAVLQDATRNWGLPLNMGKIVDAKPGQWAYGCDRSTFPYPCDPVLVKQGCFIQG